MCITDAELHRRVLAELESDAELRDREIGIAADRLFGKHGSAERGPVARVAHGWVTLEGEVDLVHERSAAEESIRHLPGVRGVSNRLTVRPPETVHRIQAKIDAALSRVLRPVMAALPTTDFEDPSNPGDLRALDSGGKAASHGVAPERSQ